MNSSRGWTRFSVTATSVLFLPGLVAVILHYVSATSDLTARIVAVAPYLMAFSLLGLLLAAALRRWWLVGVGVVLASAAVVTQAPLYLGSTSDRSPDLVVLQANIYLGRADIASLADTVTAREVDVLTVSELTDSALATIKKSSIVSQLPYSVTFPIASGGAGTGLFSRFPLSDAERLRGFQMANLRAECVVPGRGRTAVYALHPTPPWPEAAWHWAGELARLHEVMANERLPIIAGGDFNSTWDHQKFRHLLSSTNLVDAAEHTGAGILATFPANRWFPALLGIDRIVTRGGWEPISLDRVDLPASDHYGVIAQLSFTQG